MKLTYHVDNDEELKHVLHSNYLKIRDMSNVPTGVRLKLLSTLFSANPNNWRVVGITDAALDCFEKHSFRRVSRMGINRSHLVQRAEQYKAMLFDDDLFETSFKATETFWVRYMEGDRTVLATSKENMSDLELRYTAIPEALGLFKTQGFAWKHGDEEEAFLRDLALVKQQIR